MVAIQAKTWMPLGMATAMLAAEKKPRESCGMPVANMWWTHRPKRQEAGADDRQHDQPVADERRLRHGGHDHRHHAGGRQEDDVDLRVAEEPEQVLPQQRVAALLGDEERPVEGALQLQQQRRQNDRRESEHDHHGEDQHRPGVDRQLVERLPGRARLEHADDDLDRAGDGRDLDEADAEQPEIGVDAGRELRSW